MNDMRQSNREQKVLDWFRQDTSYSDSGSTESLSHLLAVAAQVLKEYKIFIIALTLLGMTAGVLKALSEPNVYQASLTMAVEPSSVRNASQSIFDPYAARFYQTQYELIRSRSVAERVVESLNLAERADVSSMLVIPSLGQQIMDQILSLLGIEGSNDEALGNEALLDLTQEQLAERRRWLTAVVQGGVNVSGGAKTHLVRVTFDSTNPQFAAEVANALVTAYIDQGLDSQADRSQQTTRWLSQRIDDLKQALDGSQAALQAFLIEEDMLGSTQSNQITTSELQALNAEYNSAVADRDELAKRYGARHPRMTEANAEVAAAKARLDLKSRNIASSRVKAAELSRLERDVERNQELYEAFLTKFKEADLSASGERLASARIVDAALPPGAPIYPQKERIVILWTLGGLILGIGLALLREQLDTTFKGARQLEEKLGLPVFGVLQSMAGQEEQVETLYLENKRSVFSESLNHIRTGVMYSDVDNPPKVVLITSSVQSEGKTTLASNLALAYAQLGPTLLIDADLRRPRIKHILKTETKFGLVDFVAGTVSLKDCVEQNMSESNLYVLNSGTAPPNPLELLSSGKFQKILKGLRERFSYIVIDSAPVLPASDAIVLGKMSDALLLAVQSDRTTHHMVREAIKRLSGSKVDINGVVLTQASIKKGNPYHYGGYYGYGAYAYAYVDNEKDKKQKS